MIIKGFFPVLETHSLSQSLHYLLRGGRNFTKVDTRWRETQSPRSVSLKDFWYGESELQLLHPLSKKELQHLIYEVSVFKYSVQDNVNVLCISRFRCNIIGPIR